MRLFAKIKNAVQEKRLVKTILKKIYPYLKGFFLIFFDRAKEIKIFTPKERVIDKSDLPLAEKILNSYKSMKLDQDQNQNSILYRPSSLWQQHLDNDFKFIKEAVKKDDLEKFLYFLQNFGDWNNYLGIENQNLIKDYSKNVFLKKFLKNEIFFGQLELWNYFNKKNLDYKKLNMPRFGNQNGAYIEGNFVVIGSFFNEIYSQIINKYIKNDKHNIIIDLGGGYGKFAYYCLRNLKKYTFIDFDIPETLTLATYYLSKSFPEKKVFLYGDEKLNNINIKDYDLIFLPPWEIEKIRNDSVELVINRNSLGEMDQAAAKNYINHIHRITKYFFSSNHEYFRNHFKNNEKSLINSEFNMQNKFKELIRYPDLGHLTYENNKIDMDSDIFFYIYQKN